MNTYESSLAKIRVENAGKAVAPLYRLAVAEREAAFERHDIPAWQKWHGVCVELAGVLGVLGCWPLPLEDK